MTSAPSAIPLFTAHNRRLSMPQDDPPPPPAHTVLVLAGRTGAGKHTVAKELAGRIGTEYIDLQQSEVGVDQDIPALALKACGGHRQIAILTLPLRLKADRKALKDKVVGGGALLRIVYLVGSEHEAAEHHDMEEEEEVPKEGEEAGVIVVDTRRLGVGDVVRVVADWVWE